MHVYAICTEENSMIMSAFGRKFSVPLHTLGKFLQAWKSFAKKDEWQKYQQNLKDFLKLQVIQT